MAVNWNLGLQQTNPLATFMQGREQAFQRNALMQGMADERDERAFQRQRLLEQDKRQAKADQRQDEVFSRQKTEWGQEDKDRLRGDLLRDAYAIREMPNEQRIAYFRQQVIPALSKYGITPEQLEPHLNDGVFSDQEVDAFIAQMGGAAGAGPKLMTATPGSWVLDAQGNVVQQVPFAPRLEQIDPTKDVYQMGGGGGPMAAPEMDFGQLEAAIVQAIPGTRVTSRTRTPQQNAAAGGVANSYHLTGQARDFVPPPGMSTAQLAAQLKSALPQGVEVIDEGDHVHIEPAPGGPTRVARGQQRPQWRDLTPAEKRARQIPENLPAQIGPDGRVEIPSGVAAAVQADTKAQERREKLRSASEAFQAKARVVTDAVDEALAKLDQFGGWGGIPGKVASGIPGTTAYDLNTLLGKIKANLGFQELQDMRNNSPTGGALGQVAVQELIALQNTVGALDIGQSEEQLRSELAKVKERYERFKILANQASAQDTAPPPPAPSAGRGGPAAQSGPPGRGGRGGASQPAPRPSLDEIFK